MPVHAGQRVLQGLRCGLDHRPAQPGGDHGHPDLVAHLRIDHGAHHHGGLVGGELLDDIADFLEFADRQVHARRDIDQNALRARQIDILEQRRGDRRLGSFARTVITGGTARAHHRHAGLGHHGSHIREVHVDQPWAGDQLGDALHCALQDGVGGLEGIQERGVAAQHRQELLVGNGDQRIDILRQLQHAVVGHARALVAFHLERPRHHCHREDAKLLGHLRHHWSRAGAGSTTHAGSDEQHVAAFDQLDDAVAILHRSLAPDFRVCPGAKTLGDVAADLQRGTHLGVLERLRVGVYADEIHTFDAGLHHVRYGVAATTAHPEHLDDGILAK